MKGLLVRLILGCAVLLWAWDMIFPWHNTTQEQENRYAQIQQRQTLSVGTVSHPISYFIGSEGASGIEYELSSAFADYLDVQLDTKTYEDTNSLFKALKKGEIDVAAAGLLYEPEQAEAFQIGASYYSASWQVVYQKGKNRPYKIEDLQEPLLIPAGSAIIPFLQRLQATNPDLKWQITSQFTQEELLIQVAEGAIPYTAAISIDVSAAQHIKPNLAVGFDLSDEMPVVWYLPAGAYSELQAALIGFMHNAHETGLISRLEEKYFNHLGKFNYVDSRSFINAIDTVLPKYKHLFEKYRGDLDWQMLAAIAYQESHWDPNATSPTGVRGMMMLTKDTAERMKVSNRTNAEQSVRGGAEYLHWIISQLPQSIAAEDRIWYALAGYNMGIGHLWDVRRLTQKLGGDPDNWLDVKKNLPLLAEKRHYSVLKYGYARGYEAFSYVENIRRYLSALQNHLRVKEQQQVADENKPLESSANEAEEKAQAVENSAENAKEQTEKTAEPATQSEVLPANSETNAENTTDKAAEITKPTEPTESTEKTIQENNDEKNEIPTKNEEKATD